MNTRLSVARGAAGRSAGASSNQRLRLPSRAMGVMVTSGGVACLLLTLRKKARLRARREGAGGCS